MYHTGDRRVWNVSKAKRASLVFLSPFLLFLLSVLFFSSSWKIFSSHQCAVCAPCLHSNISERVVKQLQELPSILTLDGRTADENIEIASASLATESSLPAAVDSAKQATKYDISLEDDDDEEEPPPPLIIPVTPTHNRAAQAFHMTQVVNFLRVVPPPILWIVVESLETTEETANLLNRTAGKCMRVGGAKKCSKIDYVHLATEKQAEDKSVSRGVRQRNAALDYIENNKIKGIVYFMDDDNAYSPELFEEIRKVKRVGLFPVGLLWSWEYKKLIPWRQIEPFVERPLVRMRDGQPQIYGWETFEWALKAEEGAGRQFNIDMAGFAFNSELLWEPKSNVTKRPIHPVRFISKFAWLETLFLSKLLPKETYAEPLADNCQDVWVWHVKFETKPFEPYPENWRVPQPSHLVQDDNPIQGISRYVKRGRRYKIKGYTSDVPFGYKRVPAPPPPLKSSAKKKKSKK